MKKTAFFLFFLSFLLLCPMTAAANPRSLASCPDGRQPVNGECPLRRGATCPDGRQPVNGECPETTTGASSSNAGVSLYKPLNSTTIGGLVGKVLGGIMGLIGTLALLMFVWGGIQYLISQGKPDQLKKAKDTLIYASLGLVIIFTSYTIVSALVKVLSTGAVE